jgi:hypothetical protein
MNYIIENTSAEGNALLTGYVLAWTYVVCNVVHFVNKARRRG